MSDLIDRLLARNLSDLERWVDFHIGMHHFTELLKETMIEIDAKLKRMEAMVDASTKRDVMP